MSAHPSTPPSAPVSPAADPIATPEPTPDAGEAAARKARRDEVAEEAGAFRAGDEAPSAPGLLPDPRRSFGLPCRRWPPPPRLRPPPPLKTRRGRWAWEVIVESPSGAGDRRVCVHRGGEDSGRVLLRRGPDRWSASRSGGLGHVCGRGPHGSSQ